MLRAAPVMWADHLSSLRIVFRMERFVIQFKFNIHYNDLFFDGKVHLIPFIKIIYTRAVPIFLFFHIKFYLDKPKLQNLTKNNFINFHFLDLRIIKHYSLQKNYKSLKFKVIALLNNLITISLRWNFLVLRLRNRNF